MSNDSYEHDAAIIHIAYAEKVKEAWKIFAENLAMGENDRGSRERFLRSVDFIRKARDMALEGMRGNAAIDPTAEAAAAEGAAQEVAVAAADGLSAEERAMIEQALAGTTGQRAAAPLPSAATRSPLMRR
jgi:hypothetical protein